ncbi:hypothetical protein ABZ491_01305 [Micromonospora rifamycinica]|uniref:hypothetical protein n=1 Tax=Micromonospora rifamycinica TaxID=291594 RepID=UPI00340A00C9
MPPTPAPRPPCRRSVTARLTVALLTVLPFAGCAAPPERRVAVPVAPPAPVVPPTTPPTALAVLPTLSSTAVPTTPGPTVAAVAVACAGRPSTDRVIGLLRGDVLPRSVSVRAVTGPLCADGWQYTVLAVSGHEELQAVTRGEPGALVLVTAGTDVCSIEVKATAPPAIRTLACEAGAGAPPGA